MPVKVLILFPPNIEFSMKDQVPGKFKRSKSLGTAVLFSKFVFFFSDEKTC